VVGEEEEVLGELSEDGMMVMVMVVVAEVAEVPILVLLIEMMMTPGVVTMVDAEVLLVRVTLKENTAEVRKGQRVNTAEGWRKLNTKESKQVEASGVIPFAKVLKVLEV